MTQATAPSLALGPILFNWKPDVWRDFYFRIADEAPVETVYVGEAICSKRAPFFVPLLDEVKERLQRAGKQVVFSTLSETVLKLDRNLVESICAMEGAEIEANDSSALYYLRGRPHRIGPLFNVYNEETLRVLASKGATHVCAPVELPGTSLAALCAAGTAVGVAVEAQVFGRQGLALSARCYHARAHGRTKDSCLFVCENDADGLDLTTLEGKPVLAVNGIQTLSYDYLNLIAEVPALKAMGVSALRLSPHSCDMVKVADIFRRTCDGALGIAEASAQLDALNLSAPYSNGFFHGKPGYSRARVATN